jgi:hypothetical protein
MGLRGKLRRLERGARENLASFVLEDGSRYYFNLADAEEREATRRLTWTLIHLPNAVLTDIPPDLMAQYG